MKRIQFILLLTLLFGCLTTMYARRQPVSRMYMFGMAASFSDTIVHFTPIQTLDSVWIETKNNFMLERDAYSYQFRDYLEQSLNMPHRTCVVFYAQKREKLEKKYQKMMRRYEQSKKGENHYDVRNVDMQDFQFRTVEATDQEDVSPAPSTKERKKGRRHRKD